MVAEFVLVQTMVGDVCGEFRIVHFLPRSSVYANVGQDEVESFFRRHASRRRRSGNFNHWGVAVDLVCGHGQAMIRPPLRYRRAKGSTASQHQDHATPFDLEVGGVSGNKNSGANYPTCPQHNVDTLTLALVILSRGSAKLRPLSI